MPGTRAGTGQPIRFCCARCRLKRTTHHDYKLTGRWRKMTKGSERMAMAEVEYKCGCGHVGKSRHIDIVRRAVSEGVIPSGTVVHHGRELTKEET